MNGSLLSAAGVLIAFLALVGPALVYLGMKLGTLQQSSEGAHKRIDRLEKMLTDEFRQMREALNASIRDAWRNCPLAHKGEHGGDP